MEIPRLNIRQEYAKIDIESQNATLDLSVKQGKLTSNTQPAVLDIRREAGVLEIDCYPTRRAMGFKNNADFMNDAAQAGMQAIKNFAARIASDSNQYSQSPVNSAAAVANIAASKTPTSKPPPGITLKYLDLPRYNYTQEKVNISYQPAKVNISYTPSEFENNSKIGSVSVSLAQQQSIRMWLSEGKFDVFA